MSRAWPWILTVLAAVVLVCDGWLLLSPHAPAPTTEAIRDADGGESSTARPRAAWRRDETWPVPERVEPQTGAFDPGLLALDPPPQPPPPDVEVQAVFDHPRWPAALVDGRVVAVGDTVAGHRIVEIEDDHIALQSLVSTQSVVRVRVEVEP